MNTTPNNTKADPDGSETLYFAALNMVLDSKAWLDVTARMELLASIFAHLSGQCGHPLDVDIEALRTELDELSSALLPFQPKHDALSKLRLEVPRRPRPLLLIPTSLQEGSHDD